MSQTLPDFCEVVPLAQPYLWSDGKLVRWTFACHHAGCEGKDMSRQGVGIIVAQAISAAELHARLVHQWTEKDNRKEEPEADPSVPPTLF